LKEFPEIGRPDALVEGYRDLFISFGSRGYILRYRLENGHIVIVRLWHALEHK